MSTVVQVLHSLFPRDTRPARRRAAGSSSTLSHLVALTCALIPFGAMLHAWVESA